MKTTARILSFILVCSAALAGLEPSTISQTFLRDGTNNTLSGRIPCGGTILLTNCYAKTGATSTQDLTGVYGHVRIGNGRTNTVTEITVQDATNGMFWCLAQVPTATALIVTNPTYSNLYYWETDANTLVDTDIRVQLTLTNGGGTIVVPYTGTWTAPAYTTLQ
jgi:hypothetical protein